MTVKSWHAVVLLTAIAVALTLAEVPRDSWFTMAAVSLSLGAASLTLMGAAALLGGRIPIVESLFGGLDRVYQVHKWLAVWALVFASVHFTVRAGLREWDTAAILALPAATTRLVRQLSFVALMGIVVLALNRNIPYGTWRLWHKLSGPAFVIVILHWLSIKSPIALASPAGVWLAAVAALGVAAAAYKLLLYPLLAQHAEYRIVKVSPGASAVHLELAPVRRPVRFEPGQFGFLVMKEEGLREPHPFTIASGGPPGSNVDFVIRALGDYTNRLFRLARPGMYADVYAPYGRFRRCEGAGREIWIAGGVGISPFIAWLRDPAGADFDRVTFFYFFTPGRDFPSADVIRELAERRGVQLIPNATGAHDPEFVRRFEEIVREVGPQDVGISFCGPKGLLTAVRELMKRAGVPPQNLHYEYFEFR